VLRLPGRSERAKPRPSSRARPASGDVFREAGQLAAERATPISDVRSSARYRKLLVATLVERALTNCHDHIVQGGR